MKYNDIKYTLKLANDGTGVLQSDHGNSYPVIKSYLNVPAIILSIDVEAYANQKHLKGVLRGPTNLNGKPLDCFKLYLPLLPDAVVMYGKTIENIISDSIYYMDTLLI